MQTAKDVCYLVKNYKARIKAILPTIISTSRNETEIIMKVLDMLGVTQENRQALMTQVNFDQGTICGSGSDINQVNIFDNTKCAEIMGCIRRSTYNNNRETYYNELLGNFGKEFADRQLAYLDKICTYTGTQINIANVTQDCNINNAINALDLTRFNPIIYSIFESLLENGKDTPEVNCDTIPTNIKSEDYIKMLNSCVNYIGLNQKNVAICANNFYQSNIATPYQECKLSVRSAEPPSVAPSVSSPSVMQPPPSQPRPLPKEQTSQNYNLYILVAVVMIFFIFVVILLMK